MFSFYDGDGKLHVAKCVHSVEGFQGSSLLILRQFIFVYSKDVRLPVQLQRAMAAEAEAAREARAKVNFSNYLFSYIHSFNYMSYVFPSGQLVRLKSILFLFV